MCLIVPGRIVSEETQGNSRHGQVESGGVTREASLDLVPEARVGEYVLMQVDVAIRRIDEVVAARMVEALQRIAGAGGAFTRPPSPSRRRHCFGT